MNVRTLIVAVLIVVTGLGTYVFATDPSAGAETKSGIVLVHTWIPRDDVTLTAEVVRPSQSGPSDSRLVILRAGKQIFSLSPGAAPASIFSTGEAQPRLITVWISGSGAYQLRIFAFLNGKVVQVLDDGSKLMPEFVYPASSLTTGSQRIIFARGDWVVDEKSGKASLRPTAADVYTWNGETYLARKGVSWKDRLSQ